ncbi:MAG TPA: DsbE family thiol:disulfide interchange protein [Solimonas sp.]|nr:DsbE family thiol:disulfide interchange protein [Solimonas sp.]
MRWRYLLPIAVLAGLTVLFAFGLQQDPRLVPSPLIGKPMPAFDQARLGAEGRATQADLVGRPLLVNFWASWCAGCQVEHPFLMQLASQGVEIVGIDYKDTDEAGLAWLGRHGNPFRSLVADREGVAGLDWGVYGVPETFVIDARGVIVYKHVGPLDERVWREQIRPRLQEQS